MVDSQLRGRAGSKGSPPGLLLLASIVASLTLAACGTGSAADPDNASCNAPPVSFGAPLVLANHAEVSVRFTCEGAAQAGTIYLPNGAGPHPAAVWVHGDGPMKRIISGTGNVIAGLVQAGVAVLSYDKRGVGESQGVCCPGAEGRFNLLAADAVGAVNALRSMPGIDQRHVGLLGGSQAGWIVPLAAARSSNVAFTALVDAPAVTQDEEKLYSLLTGEEGGAGGVLSHQAIAYRLKQAGPSGFDPLPSLEKISVPGLWLYGGADESIPADRSIAILDSLKKHGKDFTVIVLPGAGHGLLNVPPSDPRALPTLVEWVTKQVHAPDA